MIAERKHASCKNRRGIAALKMKASDVQSVTLGINVNARFEAVSIGLVSVNKKPSCQSGIVRNFADAIASKNRIQETADWHGDKHYQLIDKEEKRGIIGALRDDFQAVRASLNPNAGSATMVHIAADSAGGQILLSIWILW